jgi:hypothetical protein
LSVPGAAHPAPTSWRKTKTEESIVGSLAIIRSCVTQRKILWTYHVNMRLKGRFISRYALLISSPDYEIIEEYPDDKYLPSYLVRSEYEGNVLHILFAVDVKADNIRTITAYRSNLEEWEDGFRIRRHGS